MSLIIALLVKTVSSLLLNGIEQLQLENKYHLFSRTLHCQLDLAHQTSQQESQGVSALQCLKGTM